MPDGNDKIKVLYDAVSKNYNLGTEKEFRDKLSNPEKRKAFYDGVGAQYDLGTFDQFQTKIGFPEIDKPAAPKKYQKAVEEDRSSWKNVFGSAYNLFVGSMQRLGEGAVELLSGPGFIQEARYNSGLMSDKEKFIYEIDKKVSPFIRDRVKSDIGKVVDAAKIKSITPKDTEAIVGGWDMSDGIGERDLKALVAMSGQLTGDILLAAPTYGATYFIQGYGDGVKEYDNAAKKSGIEPDNNARALFGTTNGVVNGLLETFALNKIFGKGPALKNLQKKVVAEVLNETAQKAGKKSVEAIEKLAESKIRKIASGVRAKGAKVVYSSYVEGATEGIQTGLTEAAKIITNKVQDKEVFDEEDIVKNVGKNILNSAAAGAALGLPLGGLSVVNTKIDNQVLKDIAKAKTDKDFENIYAELEDTFNENNFSEEERAAIMNQARRYSEIKQKIPNTVPSEAQQQIIPLINERDSVEAELEIRKSNSQNIDKALSESENADVKILEAKARLLNDKIVESSEGEKYSYFEDNGRYYKQFGDNRPEEIGREYYDLADVSRIQYDEKVSERPTRYDLVPTIVIDDREYYGTDHGEAMNRAIEAGEDIPSPDTPEGNTWREENGVFSESNTDRLLTRDEAQDKYGVRRSADLTPIGVEERVVVEEAPPPAKEIRYTDREAKRIFEETDVPITADGIAEWALASGRKVSYESFKKETGGKSEGFTSAFTPTSKEKAPSVERLSEMLWEEYVPEDKQQDITNMDIRDALINTMLSYTKKTDLVQDFIKKYNPRVAEEIAESYVPQEYVPTKDELVILDDATYLKSQYDNFLKQVGEVEESARLSDEYVDNLIKEYEQGIFREGEPSPARAERKPAEPTVPPRSIEEAREAVGEVARRLGDDAEISEFDVFSRKEQSRPDFDAEYRRERVDGETVEQYLLKKYCK